MKIDIIDYLEANGLEMLEMEAGHLNPRDTEKVTAWAGQMLSRDADPVWFKDALRKCYSAIVINDFLSRYTDDELAKLLGMFRVKSSRAGSYTLGLCKGCEISLRDLAAYKTPDILESVLAGAFYGI